MRYYDCTSFKTSHRRMAAQAMRSLHKSVAWRLRSNAGLAWGHDKPRPPASSPRGSATCSVSTSRGMLTASPRFAPCSGRALFGLPASREQLLRLQRLYPHCLAGQVRPSLVNT